MGTIRTQPARLPTSRTLTAPPQQLVLPLWRWGEPAEGLPLLLLADDEAVRVLPHQVWPQLRCTEQDRLRRALLPVLQEVLYASARPPCRAPRQDRRASVGTPRLRRRPPVDAYPGAPAPHQPGAPVRAGRAGPSFGLARRAH